MGRYVRSTIAVWLASVCACGDDASRRDAGYDAGRDAAAADAGDSSAGGDAGTDAGPDAGPPVVVLPDEREPCADHDPLRNAYFGDLHVHTSLSFDAAAYDVRTTPRDAYAFARGEPIGLPPHDAMGRAMRTARLARPLDFVAVTDHSEFLGEVSICNDPSSPGYDSSTCTSYRDGDASMADYGELVFAFIMENPVRPRLCRMMPELCADALSRVWGVVQDAAEEAYDRSSRCSFTSFVAYEWTGTTGGDNIHRNVIFRSRSVPRLPVSYIDASTPALLWRHLHAGCNDTGTPCEALAIPHNSNLAAGNMFLPITDEGATYTTEQAEDRRRMEPLVEVYQHKGGSECLQGGADPLSSEDELCSFETLHRTVCRDTGDPPGCTPLCSVGGGIGFLGGCVDPGDFVRGALRRGLSEYGRIGVDPFELGFVGGTDTHDATPGNVAEAGWPGHLGDTDDAPEERLAVHATSIGGLRDSPGALAVIWAEENSRDSLFDALRRRETYATSGPRIVLRVFGGWDFRADLCDGTSLVETGYRDGTPMGGRLADLPPAAAAPSFAVSALRDPMGAPLSHLQIVKGWLDGTTTHEHVYEIAGDPANGATVDESTCEPRGTGADSLCTVWRDPDFDPSQPSFYYVRVLENPTCRWSRLECLAQHADCTAIRPGDPLAACCDPSVPQTIQERAWSSPIWYLPPRA